MLDRQNHAAGGANSSIMVGMFVCLCLTSKKPSEREFFVPAGTDLGVKLLKHLLRFFLYQGYDIPVSVEAHLPAHCKGRGSGDGQKKGAPGGQNQPNKLCMMQAARRQSERKRNQPSSSSLNPVDTSRVNL